MTSGTRAASGFEVVGEAGSETVVVWSREDRRIKGMSSGTIARLLIDKGFGFIRDEGGIEHFFHRSAVQGAVFELLREGQRVEFEVEESAKGPRAGGVRLIES